ncbi:MAG: DedA family protein [Burkholderiales bacterium]
MELLTTFVQYILHLDQHLMLLAQNYGLWIYAILFAIIFCETGLVVTPFLPGDSLLFVAGGVAAGVTADGVNALNVHVLTLTLITAAFLGNLVNFFVGRYLGRRIFSKPRDSIFLKQAYLDRTHAFFEKHGGKTIVLSRFVPIVRTYAPFVAGIGNMSRAHFALFNIVGAVAWCASLIYAGYFFGNLPWFKKNLSLVIIGIIILSVMPAVFEFIRTKIKRV